MALPDNPHQPEHLLETDDDLPADPGGGEGAVSMDQLREILADQNRLNQEALRAILQGTAKTPLQPEDQFPELNISAEGLPHPGADLDGFIKGWSERTNAAMKEALQGAVNRAATQATATATAAVDQKALTQRAFEMIKEAAPEMSDDVIGFSAMKIAEQYRAQGIDPLTALRSDVVGIAQAVLDYADERFGAGTDMSAQQLQRRGPGGGNRTGGLPGTGGARRSRQPAPEDAGDLTKDVRTFQAEFFKTR